MSLSIAITMNMQSVYGLEMDINLDFHDKNLFSRCANMNKHGVYF